MGCFVQRGLLQLSSSIYLKRLEIHGFKSFADPTSLDLPPGITAIVGPNGCGKSNLADAVRWALGEQNVRELRGSRLEDVIFAGSEGRRSQGLAEVVLTFDNRSGRLPLPFVEVAVGRRVYRSGESQFTLNRNPCRLRDIHDLLSNTGLGPRSRAVISQGTLEQILFADPEERRAWLEEVAGTGRYRQLRGIATSRLGRLEEALGRLSQLTGELAMQLTPLGREAARAERALETERSLLAVRRNLVCRQAIRWHRQLRETEAQHQQARARLEEALQAAGRRAAGAQAAQAEVQAAQARLSEAADRLEGARSALRELSHRRELLEARQRELQRRAAEIGSQRRRIQSRLGEAQSEREEAAAERVALEQLRAARRQAAAAMEQAITEAAAQLTRREQALEDKRRAAWQEMRARIAGRERLRALVAELAAGEDRIEELRRQAREAAQQEAEARQAAQRLEEEARQLAVDAQQADAESRRLAEEARSAREAAARQLQAVRALEGKLQGATLRLEALTRQEAGLQGYRDGVRAVIAWASEGHRGVLGVLGQLVQVIDPTHTRAMEAAFGSGLQSLVAEQGEDARQAIEYLRAHRKGWASFLPLDRVRPRPLAPADRALLSAPGVVGLASELVSCDPKVRPAVEYLAGRVLVTRDLKTALDLARAARSLARVVTLEGDVVIPGGAVSGGYRKLSEEGELLRRRQQREELARAVAELRRGLAEARRSLEGAEGRARALAEQRGEASARAHQAQSRLASIRERLEWQQKEIRRLQQLAAAAGEDLQRAERALESLRDQRAELVRRWGELPPSAGGTLEAEDRLGDGRPAGELAAMGEAGRAAEAAQAPEGPAGEDAQASAAELRAIRDRQRRLESDLAGLRQELASVEARLEAFGDREARARRELERLGLELADLQLQEAQCGAELEQVASALAAQEAEHLELRGREAELQRGLQAAQAERDRLGQAAEEARHQEAAARREADYCREALHARELELERVRAEGRRVLPQLESLGLTLEQALAEAPNEGGAAADPEDERLARRIEELQGELRRIGPVNPGAIEAYAEARQRYDGLESHRLDLERTLRMLRQAIDRLDGVYRQRVLQTFDAVQHRFGAFFVRLFGGGTARLVWQGDEPDPMHAGIELVAQPPGKSPQPLVALSGGERALAAISLVLAILELQPVPFCLLDEIDAALDEANLVRFAGLVREMARDRQMVIITHRQTTMEAAQVLYGVTMEQGGVSKVVSVRLEEVSDSSRVEADVLAQAERSPAGA